MGGRPPCSGGVAGGPRAAAAAQRSRRTRDAARSHALRAMGRRGPPAAEASRGECGVFAMSFGGGVLELRWAQPAARLYTIYEAGARRACRQPPPRPTPGQPTPGGEDERTTPRAHTDGERYARRRRRVRRARRPHACGAGDQCRATAPPEAGGLPASICQAQPTSAHMDDPGERARLRRAGASAGTGDPHPLSRRVARRRFALRRRARHSDHMEIYIINMCVFFVGSIHGGRTGTRRATHRAHTPYLY